MSAEKYVVMFRVAIYRATHCAKCRKPFTPKAAVWWRETGTMQRDRQGMLSPRGPAKIEYLCGKCAKTKPKAKGTAK